MKCQECKREGTAGHDVNPYWFHELRKAFWLHRHCLPEVRRRFNEKYGDKRD